MAVHASVERIRGKITQLRTHEGSEDFVFRSGERALGGSAAVGLVLGGLTGAAAGALISPGNASDKVTFFSCSVNGRRVVGRFGEVSFLEGDEVEIAGSGEAGDFVAYAIARPSDRTIWMYPHSGRGSRAYVAFCARWIALLSIGFPIAVFGLMSLFAGAADVEPWFWVLAVSGSALIMAIVMTWMAQRFAKFARLSDEILSALGFDAPQHVSLPERLSAARKPFSHQDHLKYHPHARWVYKY